MTNSIQFKSIQFNKYMQNIFCKTPDGIAISWLIRQSPHVVYENHFVKYRRNRHQLIHSSSASRCICIIILRNTRRNRYQRIHSSSASPKSWPDGWHSRLLVLYWIFQSPSADPFIHHRHHDVYAKSFCETHPTESPSADSFIIGRHHRNRIRTDGILDCSYFTGSIKLLLLLSLWLCYHDPQIGIKIQLNSNPEPTDKSM